MAYAELTDEEAREAFDDAFVEFIDPRRKLMITKRGILCDEENGHPFTYRLDGNGKFVFECGATRLTRKRVLHQLFLEANYDIGRNAGAIFSDEEIGELLEGLAADPARLKELSEIAADRSKWAA